MSVKTKKNSASQITGVIRSEQLYSRMALMSHEKGLLRLTENQLQRLEILKKYNFVELPKAGESYSVLTDGARNTVKVNLITAGLPHSPLKESNRASTKALEAMNVVGLMRGIQKMRSGSEKLYVDFVTLTFQNVGKGQLRQSMDDLKKGYRQLKDWMRKTYPFTVSHLLGGLPSFEITVNSDCLAKRSGVGLFHPHIHIVLYFDCPTTSEKISSDIF